MRKRVIFSAFVFMMLSVNVLASTVHIQYDGEKVNQVVHVKTGDVIMIHTSVPVGEGIIIYFCLAENKFNDEMLKSFHFTSSLVNGNHSCQGPYSDTFGTGASPGWITYTYDGSMELDVEFIISNFSDEG